MSVRDREHSSWYPAHGFTNDLRDYYDADTLVLSDAIRKNDLLTNEIFIEL
jgi:hypothetical protein